MADLRSTRVFGELTVMHNATVQGNLTVAGILEAASITGKASSADVLATARTLKIGNSSKTFNGSANVAWTLAEIGAAAATTSIVAGTGLTGGGTLDANRTLNVAYGTTANTAAQGNDSRINNGQTAFGWGNHATAGYVKTDTTYTAGNGLTLSGNAFSLPVSVSGSGTFVTSVSQTASGIAVTLGTPPDTNTTYAEITEAEVTAGTAATLRTISGRRLKQAVDTHGLKIGTTASTAKAGNWTPSASEIPNLDAGKITSGVFAAARIPTLNQNTTGSAAKLTTARTLTIGSSGKAFDGSANISWTLAEIGAASAVHTHTIANVTGLQAALDAGLKTMTVPGNDLNNAMAPGIYYWTTGVANAPTVYGSMVVTAWDGTGGQTAEQLVMKNGNMWIRGKNNSSSSWTAWKEMGAGKAIGGISDVPGLEDALASKIQLNTTNIGRLIVLNNSQTVYSNSAIEAQSLTGDVVISLHAAGSSATAIRHVRGAQGVRIEGTTQTLAPLTASVLNGNSVISHGTANATSATTGSLRSSGGLGVALDIFAGGNITAYSDIRKKKDIVTIDGALDIILKARGVYYTRKDTGAKEVGFIAQEMQKILPRVVGGAEETGLGISYGNITAVLAEAVKTVYNDHVTPAKERISQLEDQNQKLIERLERLEALVSNKLLNEE